MKRPTTVDAAKAASFVLGALAEDARTELGERMAASPALREEVASLRAVADELLLAADPAEPRPAVRERLLARVASEAPGGGARPHARAAVDAADTRAPRPPLPELLFALEPDAVWKDIAPGLQLRMLSRGSGGSSYVVRVAPGATVPSHEHPCVEHSYILSGSIDVEGTLCHAGDYHRAASGTRHDTFYSAGGCVMLVVESSP